MATDGLVIRTQDGATYYLRNEILDACLVRDEEAEVTEAMIGESNDVDAFSLNFARPVSVASQGAQGALIGLTPNVANANQLGEKIKQGMSTVMCCW